MGQHRNLVFEAGKVEDLWNSRRKTQDTKNSLTRDSDHVVIIPSQRGDKRSGRCFARHAARWQGGTGHSRSYRVDVVLGIRTLAFMHTFALARKGGNAQGTPA